MRDLWNLTWQAWDFRPWATFTCETMSLPSLIFSPEPPTACECAWKMGELLKGQLSDVIFFCSTPPSLISLFPQSDRGMWGQKKGWSVYSGHHLARGKPQCGREGGRHGWREGGRKEKRRKWLSGQWRRVAVSSVRLHGWCPLAWRVSDSLPYMWPWV